MPTSTGAPPSRRQVAVAITAVLVIVGGAVGIASWRGGEEGGQRVQPATPLQPPPASDTSRAPQPSPAAISTSAVPGAAPASAIPDAGIAAAPPPPPAVDAAIAQPHKPGAGAHHSTGGDHGSSGSAARPRIDRSD
jgi:hypothetical protein